MNRVIVVLLTVLLAAPSVGCTSINANKLLQASNGLDSGYDIVLQFSNALNLPDRADVIMDGASVGVVTSVKLRPAGVDVTARIRPGVTVPADVRAALEQPTLLGDLYVALQRTGSSTSAATLPSGATVPETQTVSPPQLEDTIAHLANFVGSGSIQRAQKTILGINRVMPSQPEDLRAVASQTATDLDDLSRNIDTVDTWFDGVADTAETLQRSTPIIDRWLTPAGLEDWDRSTHISTYISILLPSLGSIYNGGFWLVPMLNSLGDAMNVIRQTKWKVEDEIPRWRRLFTDYFLPADKYPAMNITSVVAPDGREISGDVHTVLRMIGAIP